MSEVWESEKDFWEIPLGHQAGSPIACAEVSLIQSFQFVYNPINSIIAHLEPIMALGIVNGEAVNSYPFASTMRQGDYDGHI
jgi:hypothetical protein